MDLAEEYQANGFVVVRGVVPESEARSWKAESAGILEDVRRAAAERGEDPDRAVRGGVYVGLAASRELFRRVARDARILDPLEACIGPKIEFLSDKVAFKSAGTDFGTPWHQDWMYWRGAHKASVWIALDPATRANGCLKLLPGSHKAQATHDGQAPESEGFGHRLRPDSVDDSAAVVVEAAPGDAVIFHDLTLHASLPNTSGEDRWAWIGTYRSASEPDQDYEWAVAAEIVRGCRRRSA